MNSNLQPNPISAKIMAQDLVDELRRLAKHYMQHENAGHTLQATALVNEAYIKLSKDNLMVNDKNHFFALAAQQMRHILVDHARERAAQKRGGDLLKVTLDDALSFQSQHNHELIYLDELLTQLAQFDARGARIFELKLFSVLKNAEIAQLLEVSLTTVERDIKAAKAWLKSQWHNNL